MASDWTISSLAAAPIDIIDGDRGTNYPQQTDFLASGHCLFLNAGNVTSSGFRFSDCVFIRIQIPLPTSDEQRAIAGVLGALDDKIESNRQTSRSLERLARAIFRAWFVEFEPVKAKAAGTLSFPGMPQETFDTLPTRFVDTELGPVPEGWRVERLDDALTLQSGFDLPTLKRTPGIYPVVAASGPNGCHHQFMVRGPGVTTGRSGVLGKVFFIQDDFWPLNTSLWVKEFKRISPAYAFHLLRGLDLEAFNSGSAVPTLNRNHVHDLPVCIPTKQLVETFDAYVVPLMRLQAANDELSRKLAALRDYLLPKLLRGEVRVAADSVCSILEPTAAARERRPGHE